MKLSAGNVTRKVASYSYDDIGRLVSLKRSGNVGVVNYAYNIRNWLKEMKSDRFSQNLWYETTGAYPCFNGNISRLQWQSGKDHVLRGYDFAYDGSFDFKDGANADVEYFYDANGALVKDLNKGISNIEYDVLGNLYGHAYFYELKQKNPSIEPSHTFGVVGYVKEFDPYFNQVVSYPVFGKNNTELEEQINIVEQQAIDNYEKNNR